LHKIFLNFETVISDALYILDSIMKVCHAIV